MKISELLEDLKWAQDKYGDIAVTILDPDQLHKESYVCIEPVLTFFEEDGAIELTFLDEGTATEIWSEHTQEEKG